MRNGPGLEGAIARSPTSPDYLPNFHGTLGHDGNADTNRFGGKKFLGQIVSGDFGGNAAFVCISNLNIYYAQDNVESYAEASSILSSFSNIHHFSPERKEVR